MKKIFYFFCLSLVLAPLAMFSQQIENPGFEEWESVGNFKDEPVQWSTIKTSDNPTIANVAPVTYDKSTDAHSGSFALKLFNLEVFNLSATGAITNGRFHAEFDLSKSYSYTDPSEAQWNLPFTWRPDSLIGWFKFFPQGNDAAQFKVILHVDSCKLPENGTLPNWVGLAVYKTPSGVTFDSWTRFSVPFDYYDNRTPQWLFTTMNSGDSTTSIPDSYLLLDDIELKYSPAGIDDKKLTTEFLRQENGHLKISLSNEEEFMGRRFALIDMSAQYLINTSLESDDIALPSNLAPGIYVAVLQGQNYQYSQKIVIR